MQVGVALGLAQDGVGVGKIGLGEGGLGWINIGERRIG